MKKGVVSVEIISIGVIIIIIGIIVSTIVSGIVQSIKEDADKISIDNYANSLLYSIEIFKKNNDVIPNWCTKENNKLYYDQNYNGKYDQEELICDVNCVDERCIKDFIMQDDLEKVDKNIKCNKIIIDDNGLVELSECSVDGRKVHDYVYKVNKE